jgi:hypothetical protein
MRISVGDPPVVNIKKVCRGGGIKTKYSSAQNIIFEQLSNLLENKKRNECTTHFISTF